MNLDNILKTYRIDDTVYFRSTHNGSAEKMGVVRGAQLDKTVIPPNSTLTVLTNGKLEHWPIDQTFVTWDGEL